MPGSSIRLEPVAPHHARQLLAAIEESASDIIRWMGERFAPRTSGDVDAFINEWVDGASAQQYFGCVAVDERERIVGFGLINQINRTHRFCNLGYWVRNSECGRGVATEITRQLATFAFSLELERVEIVIEVSNIASQRVAEKAGALREGLLRKRLAGRPGPARDAFMFSLVR